MGPANRGWQLGSPGQSGAAKTAASMVKDMSSTPEPVVAARTRGRPPAGQDPLKRIAILVGADRVFSASGFDVASMDDIAKAAGVSKATLYVYFADKTQLFSAMIAAQRADQYAGFAEHLAAPGDVRTVLTGFGRALAISASSEWSLRINRIVLGVAERMPDVGREFFETGPMQLAETLAAYLEQQQSAGALRMHHTFFAAVQFIELCQAALVRPRLYRAITTPPGEDEINRIVAGAVYVFMAAYGRT
jgi:AcrR family transcriptional regulator